MAVLNFFVAALILLASAAVNGEDKNLRGGAGGVCHSIASNIPDKW
jgi:hypothetical protein